MFFAKKLNVQGKTVKIPRDMAAFFRAGSYYEKNVIFWFDYITKLYLRPVIYDIGSNYGYFSVRYSGLARMIYAFEPVTATYKVLKDNINNNKIDNVVAFKLGVSDKAEELKIHLYSSSGNNSLFKRNLPEKHPLKHCGIETIQTVSLDSHIEENKLLPPNILKIDVEGAELFVLQGARRTIREHHPAIIMEYAETTSNDAGYSTAQLFEELRLADYLIYGIPENVDDQKLYPMQDASPENIANILAVPRSIRIDENFLRI